MRLNKYISESGLCSRREADELIAAGRVTVDGEAVEIAFELTGGELVCVDGNEVRARGTTGSRKVVYIALYKPVGITSTTEREVDDNIVDFIDHAERIFPIGRLDKDSEGLILLTNDGDIVNPILRAENRHEKEYLVEVNHAVTPEFLSGMARGVQLDRYTVTAPCRVSKHGRYGFRIVLTQGLNRQIRRMAQAFGYRVKILRRVRIMHIQLGHLKPGQWRNLTPPEVAGLMKHCEEAATRAPVSRQSRPAQRPPRPSLGKRGPAAAGNTQRTRDERAAMRPRREQVTGERASAPRGRSTPRSNANAWSDVRTSANPGPARTRRFDRDAEATPSRGRDESDSPRSARAPRRTDAAPPTRRGRGQRSEPSFAAPPRTPRGRGRR